MDAAAGVGTKVLAEATVKPLRLSVALHPCPQMPTETAPDRGGVTRDTLLEGGVR